MHDLEKTAVFHAFRAGALDELEKIATDHGLSDLEKVAFLGHVGKFMGRMAGKAGARVQESGLRAGMRGAGAKPGMGMEIGLRGGAITGAGSAARQTGHGALRQRMGEGMRGAGEWMVQNPRAAGAMGLGAAAAPVGLGGAFAAGGAAGEGHQALRRGVRGR